MTFNNEKTAGSPSVEAGEATIEEEDVTDTESTDNIQHSKLQDNITCSPGDMTKYFCDFNFTVKTLN